MKGLQRNYLCLLVFILLYPSIILAAVQEWKILPQESKLTFTATQNGAPVTGEFKQFEGNIAFDPLQLNNSHVKIVVTIASLSTSYSDLTKTLTTSDWFDSVKYPQAIFETSNFKKISDNHYEADGKLTIRNKTLPITLTFTADDFTKPKVAVSGEAMLKRIAYEVGQGEWASTDEVKNEVTINFKLSAVKK